jgi:hypothetical protein
MAFGTSSEEAKPPARSSRARSVASSPRIRRSTCMPTALAAFAWARWLASARESVMPRSGTTVTAVPPSAKAPRSFMAPVRRSSASRSTRPEPQIPCGSTSPIVRTVNAPFTRRTDSMAPSAPGIPYRTRPPSKAGPAGQEQARVRIPSDRITSVFVPTSTSIRGNGASSPSMATRSAAASAPTWQAMSGAPQTRACGWTRMPSSWARRSSAVDATSPARQAVSLVDRNGDRPIGSTSSPKARSRMVALPTTTTSTTWWRSTLQAAYRRVSSWLSARRSALRSSPGCSPS